jgi:hypothetical protein
MPLRRCDKPLQNTRYESYALSKVRTQRESLVEAFLHILAFAVRKAFPVRLGIEGALAGR